MYTLYYSPGACSMAVHVLLNELGQRFELVPASLDGGKSKNPEFLKVNPRGQVPVLVDDGMKLREGAAILVYLAEKHGSPLLPKGLHERAAALEWLMFCNSTLHPAYGRVFGMMKMKDKIEISDGIMHASIDQIQKLWDDVEMRLAESPYLAGPECTLADILCTVIANWGSTFPKKITLGANTRRLVKKISERHSYQQALKAENVEYQAAA